MADTVGWFNPATGDFTTCPTVAAQWRAEGYDLVECTRRTDTASPSQEKEDRIRRATKLLDAFEDARQHAMRFAFFSDRLIGGYRSHPLDHHVVPIAESESGVSDAFVRLVEMEVLRWADDEDDGVPEDASSEATPLVFPFDPIAIEPTPFEAIDLNVYTDLQGMPVFHLRLADVIPHEQAIPVDPTTDGQIYHLDANALRRLQGLIVAKLDAYGVASAP